MNISKVFRADFFIKLFSVVTVLSLAVIGAVSVNGSNFGGFKTLVGNSQAGGGIEKVYAEDPNPISLISSSSKEGLILNCKRNGSSVTKVFYYEWQSKIYLDCPIGNYARNVVPGYIMSGRSRSPMGSSSRLFIHATMSDSTNTTIAAFPLWIPYVGRIVVEPDGTTVKVYGSYAHEYRMDEGVWQSSNIFYNVSVGEHKFKVRNIAEYSSPVETVTIFPKPVFNNYEYDGNSKTLTINAINGAGYELNSPKGAVVIKKQQSNVFKDVEPGTYSVAVYNGNDLVVHENIVLSPPEIPVNPPSNTLPDSGDSVLFLVVLGLFMSILSVGAVRTVSKSCYAVKN